MDLQYTEIIFNTQMQYGKKKKKKNPLKELLYHI